MKEKHLVANCDERDDNWNYYWIFFTTKHKGDVPNFSQSSGHDFLLHFFRAHMHMADITRTICLYKIGALCSMMSVLCVMKDVLCNTGILLQYRDEIWVGCYKCCRMYDFY